MSKNIKRAVSLLLVSLMIFFSGASAFAATAVPSDNTHITVPTVYVQGYGFTIYSDANDSSSEKLYTGDDVSPDTISTVLNGFKTPLFNGIKTGDWTEFCDFVVNTLVTDMSKYALDDNGEPSNGSGNTCIQDNNVQDRKGSDGKYDLYSYVFKYDWRLDPIFNADELNKYIQKIKDVTGYEKVNLVGRCLGGNIVMSYLSKYGYSDVNSLAFYIGLFDGVDLVGAMFSGKLNIEPNALTHFVEDFLPEDNSLMSLIKAVIVVLNAINGLNLPIDVVHNIYNKVYMDIVPRLLLKSYGVMPCYWSYVGEKYYKDAKKLVFADKEEKYAALIEKLDRYHYDVMLKKNDILKGALTNGVNVYNFVKYGSVMAPICDEAIYANDGVTTVQSQSFGSISSKNNKPFSFQYIKEAKDKNTLKYISTDRLIDASGDTLKDHTWFIRGSEHEIMPRCIDILMANVFEANGFGNENYITTEYFEAYPKFMLASENSWSASLLPTTRDNLSSVVKKKSAADYFLYLFDCIILFVTRIVDFFLKAFK